MSENLRQMEDRKMQEAQKETQSLNNFVQNVQAYEAENLQANKETEEIKQVMTILDDLKQQSNAYPEDFVRSLKGTNPELYEAFAEEARGEALRIKLPDEVRALSEEIDLRLVEWENQKSEEEVYGTSDASDETETPRPMVLTAAKAESIRDEVRTDKEPYKVVTTKNETEEKFMVKLVDKDHENAVQIQDLVEDPTTTPVALSSRYPGKEFHYEAAKGSYYDAEGQRMLVYNGDQVTVKKEVAPASVAVEAAPIIPTEPKPTVEAPVPVIEAAPAPAPAAAPELEEPVAEDLKRKDVVAELKKENSKIVENFIALHPELTLKNTIDTGTNHREFRIGRPDSNVTTSVHFNAWTLGTPEEPEDVQFHVGDRVFGKLFYRMEDALEGAAQLIKNEEVRIAEKKEKKDTRIAEKKEKADQKEAVAKTKEENKERLADAKGKKDVAADTAVNMTTKENPAWKIG